MKIGTWVAGASGERGPDGALLSGELYEIRKDGRRKRDGGDGVEWSCYQRLPDGTRSLHGIGGKKGSRPCRHLRLIFEGAAVGVLPKQLKMTFEGKRSAGRCGCISAANAAAAAGRPKAPKNSRLRKPRS